MRPGSSKCLPLRRQKFGCLPPGGARADDLLPVPRRLAVAAEGVPVDAGVDEGRAHHQHPYPVIGEFGAQALEKPCSACFAAA